MIDLLTCASNTQTSLSFCLHLHHVSGLLRIFSNMLFHAPSIVACSIKLQLFLDSDISISSLVTMFVLSEFSPRQFQKGAASTCPLTEQIVPLLPFILKKMVPFISFVKNEKKKGEVAFHMCVYIINT